MHSKRTWSLVCLALVLTCLSCPARAELKLPAIFGDHMVLQQDKPVRVWGWADAGTEVTVALAGQTARAKAGADGAWKVALKPVKPGTPGKDALTLTVTAGKETRTLRDILVGEVWICSGQSNMAMTVSRAKDAEEEVAAANYPRMRLFKVGSQTASTPRKDCSGTWQLCSPKTVGGFSAAGYFFGRRIHKELNVPVGLVNSSWGGTCVEAWTRPSALEAMGLASAKAAVEQARKAAEAWNPDQARQRYARALQRYKVAIEKYRAAKKAGKAKGRPPRAPRRPIHPNQNAAGALYNGMIAPLIPLGIRGAIWYQGERNTRTEQLAHEYRQYLPCMIRNWRKDWGQGDLPFFFVQLPNYVGRGENSWPIIRESFEKCLTTPNTGMAIAIDVGELKNIHPKNKQAVGYRLAQSALNVAYGKDVCPNGPLHQNSKIADGKIYVTFKDVAGGLKATAPAAPKLLGFTIAGKDRTFVEAEARICPAKNGKPADTVVVWSDKVPEPQAVRYAWANDPRVNLYNSVDLPAGPFRTDTWPLPGQKQR